MRKALRIAIVAALLTAPAVAAAGSRRALAITCGGEHYKPAKIVLACADDGIWLAGLRWSSWGENKAVASGTYREIVCTPTCASGHLASRPVKVTLSVRGSCASLRRPVFKLATLTFPHGAPPYAYHRFRFVCPP